MLENNTQSFSVVTRNKDCILLTISNGSCSLLSVGLSYSEMQHLQQLRT